MEQLEQGEEKSEEPILEPQPSVLNISIDNFDGHMILSSPVENYKNDNDDSFDIIQPKKKRRFTKQPQTSKHTPQNNVINWVSPDYFEILEKLQFSYAVHEFENTPAFVINPHIENFTDMAKDDNNYVTCQLIQQDVNTNNKTL